MNRSTVILLLAGVASCAPAAKPAPAILASAAPTTAAPTPPRPTSEPSTIDTEFRSLKERLPAAATLSDANGPSVDCGAHRWATYNLLDATAAKLPIAGDADLARLIPWSRDSDVCIRQIALRAIVTKIGYDRNNLVIPSMHDTEHHIFHDVLFSLQAYLDKRHVAYDPKGFDGLMLSVDAKDYAPLVHGRWVQEIDRSAVSIDVVAVVEADRILVTHRQTTPTPGWSDTTWTTRVKGVKEDDHRRYVLTGAATTESPANTRVEPAQDYQFWLVKQDVAWFKDGNSPYWIKLRRSGR